MPTRATTPNPSFNRTRYSLQKGLRGSCATAGSTRNAARSPPERLAAVRDVTPGRLEELTDLQRAHAEIYRAMPLTDAAVRPVYRLYGREDDFQNLVYPGQAHVYTKEMRAKTLKWFETRLAAEPAAR